MLKINILYYITPNFRCLTLSRSINVRHYNNMSLHRGKTAFLVQNQVFHFPWQKILLSHAVSQYETGHYIVKEIYTGLLKPNGG